MPSLTASISLFVGIVVCYSAGLMLGWLFSRILEPIPRLSAKTENDLEKQLRTEVRDNLSRIILEVLESGEEPTLLYIAQSCPAHLRTGKAWLLWQQESHQMLKAISAEDLTLS
jgi:hypothetical protein